MRNVAQGVPQEHEGHVLFVAAVVCVVIAVWLFSRHNEITALILLFVAGMLWLSEYNENAEFSSAYQIVDLDGDYEEFDDPEFT